MKESSLSIAGIECMRFSSTCGDVEITILGYLP
jgi:hypothetical protein